MSPSAGVRGPRSTFCQLFFAKSGPSPVHTGEQWTVEPAVKPPLSSPAAAVTTLNVEPGGEVDSDGEEEVFPRPVRLLGDGTGDRPRRGDRGQGAAAPPR